MYNTNDVINVEISFSLFLKLDIEMSFVNQEDIMSLIERLVVYSWPKGEGHVPEIPFPRMTYSDAMANYGVDKPDTRFDAKVS